VPTQAPHEAEIVRGAVSKEDCGRHLDDEPAQPGIQSSPILTIHDTGPRIIGTNLMPDRADRNTRGLKVLDAIGGTRLLPLRSASTSESLPLVGSGDDLSILER